MSISSQHDCCDNGGDREKQNHQRENQYKNKTKKGKKKKKTQNPNSRSAQNRPVLVPVLFQRTEGYNSGRVGWVLKLSSQLGRFPDRFFGAGYRWLLKRASLQLKEPADVGG
jgi:hypothetical protein